jgi:predicted NAD/FAD-dependent oxidoreductase
MSPPRIAVIGAGISGLAAARLLTKNGMFCTVFEKSRGLGGRMATREIGGVTFDHGVQYLRRRGLSFSKFVDHCLEEGHIQAWTDKYFVGVTRMTAPAHALAEGLDVKFNYTVKSLARRSDGWRIDSEGGSSLGYNAILIAIPAPQTAVLLETAAVSFDGIDKVKYNPCITLMLAFENQTNFSEKFIRNRSGPISWISQNSSKPGREKMTQTFVIHANPNWSSANLDAPTEKIKKDLSLLSTEIIRTQNIPMISIVHKWKYAFVSKQANSQYFWNAQHKVGACGDYCIGASVESAFDSGEALASEVINAFR